MVFSKSLKNLRNKKENLHKQNNKIQHKKKQTVLMGSSLGFNPLNKRINDKNRNSNLSRLISKMSLISES